MRIVHDFFNGLPYIVLITICIAVYRLVVSEKKRCLSNIIYCLIAVIFSVTFIAYHFPQNQILKNYDFSFTNIYLKADKTNISMKNKADVNKIINVVNKHTFFRNASSTADSVNVIDSRLVTILMDDKKRNKTIQLYVRIENKEVVLIIGEQVYSIWNNESLYTDMTKVLKELKISY